MIQVRAEFFTNFLVIGMISVPLAMLARRLVVNRVGNIPRTFPMYKFVNV